MHKGNNVSCTFYTNVRSHRVTLFGQGTTLSNTFLGGLGLFCRVYICSSKLNCKRQSRQVIQLISTFCDCFSSFLSSISLNFDLTATIFSCSPEVHSSYTSSISGNLTSWRIKSIREKKHQDNILSSIYNSILMIIPSIRWTFLKHQKTYL